MLDSPLHAACKTAVVNAQGTAGADITVNNTQFGVVVMTALKTRCGAIIRNVDRDSGDDIRCAPSSMEVTATQGKTIFGGLTPPDELVLGKEGQQQWNCIRTTSDSVLVQVQEARP